MEKWKIVLIIGFLVIVLLFLTRKFMFKKIIGIIIDKNEGGYVNDPRDKGGETKYGIAKKYHPNIDIKNLTKEQAADIYYNEYFVKLPKIVDLNLMYQVLDMAINAGVSVALRLYKTNKTTESYKKARIAFYKSLPQFEIYGKSWINRVNRNIV